MALSSVTLFPLQSWRLSGRDRLPLVVANSGVASGGPPSRWFVHPFDANSPHHLIQVVITWRTYWDVFHRSGERFVFLYLFVMIISGMTISRVRLFVLVYSHGSPIESISEALRWISQLVVSTPNVESLAAGTARVLWPVIIISSSHWEHNTQITTNQFKNNSPAFYSFFLFVKCFLVDLFVLNFPKKNAAWLGLPPSSCDSSKGFPTRDLTVEVLPARPWPSNTRRPRRHGRLSSTASGIKSGCLTMFDPLVSDCQHLTGTLSVLYL